MKIGTSEYAKKFAYRRQKIIDYARKNLENAQKKQKEYYDRNRSSVTFNAGDMVMLDPRHLNQRHRNNGQDSTNSKLVAKKILPFKIEKMINQNVTKLTLPRELINPSFIIDLLSHLVPNPVRFNSRPVPKAVPVILDEATGDKLDIVEALVKKRMVSRQPEWLVRWHGLLEHEYTWEKEKKTSDTLHIDAV